jgi:hypothetical protein
MYIYEVYIYISINGKMFDQPFRRTIRGKLKMLMVVGIIWEHVVSAVFVKRSKARSRT